MTTFKEIDMDGNIEKKLMKAGLSIGIIFSKEDIKRFDLCYGDTIILNNAEIIKKDSNK